MNKPLSYEELIEFAKENYTNGGDGVYECWDRNDYLDYVEEFGPITKEVALKIFATHLAIWNEYHATAW